MDAQKSAIAVGDTASLTRQVTEEDIALFAQVTGDTNPVHFDEAFAAQTRFGRRIAHGMILAGYISAVVGTVLPGPGVIYMSQSLSFKAPVYPGDTITSSVEVTRVREDKPIITLRTTCTNQDGVLVLDGEAVMFHPYGELARG
jgi:3-hydroxybutyryl-CoA dehydratase